VNVPGCFLLVRHAEAERSATRDAERRLTAEGRTRFEAHARALAPSLRLARIVTSPYARARETAEILAAATGAPVDEDPSVAPGRSTGAELVAAGRRLGDAVAIVGHNPEIAEAIALLAGAARSVTPGAVAAVEFDGAGERLAWIRAP
jgi:phosphohistidine phosphatase